MNVNRNHVLAVASISFGLLVAAPARAASLTQVDRTTWGASGVPTYVQMYIYVPDKLAAKPPILVSAHSCGSTATGQMGNIPGIKAAADKNGFILILPDNPGQNCWDVGAANSLKHDGGGDTQAIAQMVKYVLTKYSGDPTRVYAMGGSSGAMMTQALMAVYPDIFKAGSARAGVPAGCWADGYDSAKQWSNTCANGTVSKTAKAWGDLVRAMYPSYTGHRPRVQIMQGAADATISYKNTAEAVKEWTNVLGLSETPTSTDKSFKGQVASYDREFWKNDCGYTVFETWSSPGGTHSMGYEEDAILKFFGLDVAGGADPEDTACGGSTGVGGAGGTSGAGGKSSTSGGTTSTGGKSSGTGTGGKSSTSTGGAVSVGGNTTTTSTSTQQGQGGSGTASTTQPITNPAANGGTVSNTTATAPAIGGSVPVSSTVIPSDSDGDSGGCSLVARDGSSRGGVLAAFAALALGVALRRRQR